MKMNMKRLTAASIATLVAISSTNLPVMASENDNNVAKMNSPVLITEVIPNTDNMGGSDAYEYYELTNISDEDVDLTNYHIVYNGKELWDPNIQKLPANTSMLVWIKNDGNKEATKADFCEYYSIPEDSLIAEVECGGLHNSKSRTLAIATSTGNVLQLASYTPNDSGDETLAVDEAITFAYNGGVVTTSYDNVPTPLTVAEGDISGVYTAPADVKEPNVIATEVSSIEVNTDLNIEVTDTNLGLENIISGSVIIDGDKEFPLMFDSENKLVATVPFGNFSENGRFTYKVSIFDGTNTAVTSEKTVTIAGMDNAIDMTKAPVLVVTELLPDSSNINGGDAYEFIEIYNNANIAINLKDYKLNYLYPESDTVTTWWETKEDKILEPGQTLVFWVDNSNNSTLTLEDFNNNFGTNLSSDQLIKIECGGMANSGIRGLSITSKTGDVIDSVIYNDGADNTNKDKTITYQNQYQNDVFETVMTSDNAEPTPGIVTDSEKPIYQAEIVTPTEAEKPVLNDYTADSFSNDTQSLNFELKAVSDVTTIKTVTLYIKNNNQEDFESYNLARSGEDTFIRTVGNVDLINKKSLTYYFEVSDGTNLVSTEVKTVTNVDAAENTELNLKDGETVTGVQQIIAYGQTLSIDGSDITSETSRSINGYGKIAFDATETDTFFKNAVAVDGEVVGIFNEGTYSSVRTYVYDIDASKFDAETKTITVEFHAGNKANVLEHNIENNDDFTIRNIRMVLPNGKTLTPVSYQAKKGLGAVEHPNMDEVELVDLTVTSQESNISMGDGTSKNEIVYATFQLEDSDFEAIRYLWDTTQIEDGEYTIFNGTEQITVSVDNTAPEITTNIENQAVYHNGTIEVEASDAHSKEVRTVVLLDGKNIEVPYEFRALEMQAGEHTLKITSRDEVGNVAEKEITFTTPNESASIDGVISPENGSTATADPTLSVKVTDESNDEMTVTFKKGERYELADTNITVDSGVSNESGSIEKVFEENTGNGFPYESFQIVLEDGVNENTVVNVKWSGTSNNAKTFMYVYNTTTAQWEKLDAVQTLDGENMTLCGDVILKDHFADNCVNVIVQNGEGYTPTQYATATQSDITTQSVSAVADTGINVTDGSIPTHNVDDTPRDEYDFTFAIESDTQYYNEDYDGNPDQSNDGMYQHQLNIHNWILANRERMNIQYLFHNGDIIDDEPNIPEWEQADAAYKLLDDAGLPYGILAGNHDVGHLNGNYTNYSNYFGEERYQSNAWYGGSYKDNRGHYDLITVGGIDFIMIYTGWGIGDEEIQWMNDVLAQYPERKAILNFHEYLLASGGLGEEPQRVHDEVIAKNENVCMVFSGHYHNAKTTIDTFTNEDGTTRNVYNMLFDYQGLVEGGAGYMRLLHFDLDGEKVIIRTYTPSHGGSTLDNYGDYDAKASANPNAGNAFIIEGAELNDSEHFEISFADLGITSSVKTLETTSLDVNVYKNEVIGTVTGVTNGEEASYTWTEADEGINGWYAEVTDANGGLTRTDVNYINVNRDIEAPVLTVPEKTELKLGDTFDVMEGISAYDNVDKDVTHNIVVLGKVNTSIPGNYELIYQVTDGAGNTKTVKRMVVVQEKSEPNKTDGNNTGVNNTGVNNTDVNNTGVNNTEENNATVTKKDSPNTGDATRVTLYGILTAVSGLTLGLLSLLGIFGKKNK